MILQSENKPTFQLFRAWSFLKTKHISTALTPPKAERKQFMNKWVSQAKKPLIDGEAGRTFSNTKLQMLFRKWPIGTTWNDLAGTLLLYVNAFYLKFKLLNHWWSNWARGHCHPLPRQHLTLLWEESLGQRHKLRFRRPGLEPSQMFRSSVVSGKWQTVGNEHVILLSGAGCKG